MPDVLLSLLPPLAHNTVIVLMGASLLGIAAGVVGCFSFLRRQALISDAISHATLPGIAAAFLFGYVVWGEGRALALLTGGAVLSGFLGMLAVRWIREETRLSEDTAIGTVLSVFFGLGLVLLSVVQATGAGGQAGLGSFLLGAVATMTTAEAWTIAGVSLLALITTAALFKTFGLACFDPDFARALGWSTRRLDLAMTGLLLVVLAIGLKAVGLVLIIAMVIIPPAAARFWTDDLARMVSLSGAIGGLSAAVGAYLSAGFPNLPTGAVIVLVAGLLFIVGLLLSPRRGMVAAALTLRARRRRETLRIALLDLAERRPMDRRSLVVLRTAGYLDAVGEATPAGIAAAATALRDHKAWQGFILRHPETAADVAEWGHGRPPTGDATAGEGGRP